LEGTEDVAVATRSIAASDGSPLRLDLYRGATPERSPPGVVLVNGYPGEGLRRMLGCGFTEMGSTQSWARLIAASGLVAVAVDHRDPVRDTRGLFEHLRDGAALGIDPARLGVLAASGSGPLGLSLLLRDGPPGVRCGAFICPMLMDLDGATGVADAAAQWRFANACAAKSIEDVRADVRILIGRAGRYQFTTDTDSIDAFATAARERGRQVSVVAHEDGTHAFDLDDDHEGSLAVVRHVLAFLQTSLLERSLS
jgi:dienelactone hydrolase